MPHRSDGKSLRKKIVSLSALGAGALALGTGTAEAGILSGTPGATIGPGQSFSNFGAGGPGLKFFVNSSVFGGSSGNANARASALNGAKLAYQNGGSTVRLFPKGAKWTTAGPLGAGGNFLVGGRYWSRTFPDELRPAGIGRIGRIGKGGKGRKGKRGGGAGALRGRIGVSGSSSSSSSSCCSSPASSSGNTHHGLNGNTSFSDQYALFTFLNGSTTLYGWVELSYAVTDSFGPNGTPDLTIMAWAYDDSGAVLGAGDTTSPTPEPATGISTGLAALALGAEGLRRWRQTRKAA